MARPYPHKRVARAAAVSIVTFFTVLTAIWLAPRMSDAVAAWLRTPPIRSVTIALPAAVRVQHVPMASADAAAGEGRGGPRPASSAGGWNCAGCAWWRSTALRTPMAEESSWAWFGKRWL